MEAKKAATVKTLTDEQRESLRNALASFLAASDQARHQLTEAKRAEAAAYEAEESAKRRLRAHLDSIGFKENDISQSVLIGTTKVTFSVQDPKFGHRSGIWIQTENIESV